jgi:hypothetical protein
MTSSNPYRLTALAAIVLAFAACTREAPEPAEAPEAQAQPAAEAPAAEPAKIPGTDAIAAVDNTPAEVGVQPTESTIDGVDTKGFAGTFATEGARIEFKADGTYAMTVHAASANADLESTGTWSAAADGTTLLLDSDDKSEPDRSYTVISKDEITQTEGGQTLRRVDAP